MDKQGSIRIGLQRLKTLFIRKGREIEMKRIEVGDIRKNERNRSVEAIKKTAVQGDVLLFYTILSFIK